MHYATLICLCLAAFMLQLSDARPNGAPERACQSLTPGHKRQPQNSPIPFDITPLNSTISLGEIVSIEIKAKSKPFCGFIIQARNVLLPHDIVGNFAPSTDKLFRLMNCNGGTENSATHTSPVLKSGVSLKWQAPAGFTGSVVLK